MSIDTVKFGILGDHLANNESEGSSYLLMSWVKSSVERPGSIFE